MQTVGTPILWGGFTALVLLLLAADLFLFHRDGHAVRPREALGWTIVWISLALLFNVGVYRYFGSDRGLEFFTGYLIELALSVDNLFVFVLIFATFRVPPAFQHRVLFWGIVGAQVMRALFILAGAALLNAFSWVIFVFGGFLIFTGVKILVGRGTEVHPEKNPVLRLFGKLVPTLPDFFGPRFTVKLDGRRYATPLLPVLCVVELTDLLFATDSIPAIFGVTKDPFIVYTSNVFAILGLRAMYFLLAHAMDRFHYLGVGLGLVLSFVGIKMVVGEWYPIPIGISLGVVVFLLAASLAASLLRPKKEP